MEFAIDVATVATPLPVAVRGMPGSIEPASELWIVNLDQPGSASVTTRALANGSFSATIDAQLGDRIRIVVRRDTQHSLPLDALAISPSPRVITVGLGPTKSLDCLEIRPADELTAVVSSGQEQKRRFTLNNRCQEPVDVTRAALRFGDAGFSLDAPTGAIVPGASAAIEVRITGHDDARERADIVLLEVRSGIETYDYALGVWSVSASSIGND